MFHLRSENIILKLQAMKSIIYIFLFSFCISVQVAAQKYSTLLVESWANSNWKNSMRTTSTFDGNGNVTKQASDSWNGTTSVWEYWSVTTHTLNSNSTVNYSITQSWDTNMGMWVNSSKMIYTYDAAKNVLTQKMQMDLGTGWTDFSMTTNTYNASNLLIKSVGQSMDLITMQMKNATQTTYTYNADGTENQSISQNWNSTSLAWVNSLRSTNTYNASKKLTQVLTEDYTSDVWVNDTKSTLTYNANGLVNEALYQDWDATAAAWVNTDKDILTYNADGSINQMTMMGWKKDQSIWENQSRMTYTYPIATFVNPAITSLDQLLVFPNPFNDFISIENTTLKEFNLLIYNANGQLVQSIENVQPHSTINLASLNNGVYFLKVVSPESEKVVKLLKYN